MRNLDAPLGWDEVAEGFPSQARLRRLKITPEVAFYLLSRGFELPGTAPKIKTPEPSWVKGAVFDPERVDRVLRSFHALRHTQGSWAGKPLDPISWQVAYILAPIFGWVKPLEDGSGRLVRIINNATIDVPRKGGKTTICGGIALYLAGADGEPGAQVIAAASTRDQAGFVFDPIKQLAESSPVLQRSFTVTKSTITHKRTFSSLKVISAIADAQHGANVHGAIIDEIHVHKKKDLIEALETGTGAREQPLIFKITTADEGRAATPYAVNRSYVEKLARGVFRDEATYGAIFAADDDDDPFKESTWRKANPGYGVTPTAASMRSAANKAKNSPAQLAAFKRLRLGIRAKETSGWIDLREWRRNAGARIHENDLRGRFCYGGLDLASVSDLCALCWLFPFEDGAEGYDAIWRFWLPEEALPSLDERTAGNASTWVKDGWLTLTPGSVADYAFIRAQVLDDMELFDVNSIGFDRWNSSQLVTDLMEDGVEMVKVGQGYASMNAPLVEMQRLVKLGSKGRPGEHRPRIRHGGNPVATWCVDNLAVDVDPAGNVKPNKAKSSEKIDGVSAFLDALYEAIAGQIGYTRSAYETGGVRAV